MDGGQGAGSRHDSRRIQSSVPRGNKSDRLIVYRQTCSLDVCMDYLLTSLVEFCSASTCADRASQPTSCSRKDSRRASEEYVCAACIARQVCSCLLLSIVLSGNMKPHQNLYTPNRVSSSTLLFAMRKEHIRLTYESSQGIPTTSRR